MLCTVVTESKSQGIAGGLTYDAGERHVQIGSHVRVPLRKKIVEGIVVEIERRKSEEEFDVKEVAEILGDKPLLSAAHIKLAIWMSEYYCCSLRRALTVFLPSPPWTKLLPEEEEFYRLVMPDAEVRGSKQKAVIDYLQNRELVSVKILKQETDVSAATLRSLIDKGILVKETKLEGGSPILSKSCVQRPALTEDQKEVYLSMVKDRSPSLLFGVTSSGKTEVYAQLIADAVADGKQSILLVPEILLTEHCIHRFEELLDRERIAILHSRLTGSQRRNEWKRIHRCEVDLVIGSRSALFAPVQNLGLIVIDEEHEWTYKNEQAPRYHARETAEELCRITGATLVFGSATPSLEAWSRCKSNRYRLERLPNRYENRPMPHVRVVDLATVCFGDLYPFSPPLLEAIEKRLTSGEQSVLFLNRRGVASALLCLECRRRVVSPTSDLPFTVHKTSSGSPYLYDHITGERCELPSKCPSCESVNLLPIGAGTQKLEHIIAKQFPNARTLRADSDTLTHPEKMRLLLKKMREGQADILLGTQSVVKGLDLPGVTLAAVLLADVGLSLPHFRAGERIFQLLTQLTGRSGRAKPGDVIIQTFRPDAPEVKLASEHKTEEYLEQELKLRLHTTYPPAVPMVRLLTRGPDAQQQARQLVSDIQSKNPDLHVHAAPTLFRTGNVWHVLIRGSGARETLKDLDLKGVVVDIDPIECI